jgi:hypothetical protein
VVGERSPRSISDRYDGEAFIFIAAARKDIFAAILSRFSRLPMRTRTVSCIRNNFFSSASLGGTCNATRRAAAAIDWLRCSHGLFDIAYQSEPMQRRPTSGLAPG